MRKVTAFIFCTVLTLSAFAQDASNADKLVRRTDVVVKKEYENIGQIRDLSIIAEHITDVTEHKKLSGLDLEYAYNGSNAATYAVLLDPVEVDSLLAFLQNVQNNISKTEPPKNYTEYSFISKSGFQAGCFWDKTWKVYVKISIKENNSNIGFSSDELVQFISFLKQARAKM